MPSPSTSLATLRPDLNDSLQEFDLARNRDGFIGHLVCPIIETQKQSGKFGRIPIEQLLKKRGVNRTSQGGYPRSSWEFTDDSFTTAERGHEVPVDDRDAEIYADYFDAEMISAEMARHTVMLDYEQAISDLIFNATTWASNKTAVGTEWSNVASVPITDVEAAIQNAFDASGLWPNAMIMSRKVFRNLRNVTQIIDRMKNQGFQDVRAGKITEQQLASVFDIPKIIVAGGVKNTADDGQTATPATIWSGEYCMIGRVAETNNVKEPCLGRTFHWAQDGSQFGGISETYRDENARADIVRNRMETDEKVLHMESGWLLENITA